MEGVGFQRAYRFYSSDKGLRVTGTVWREPGSKGPWIAIVDDTPIKVLLGGRDLAALEAIRQARLPDEQRRPPTVSYMS